MSDIRRGEMDRRRFLTYAAGAALGAAAGVRSARVGAAPPDPAKVPSYHEKMEYRRLGKTEMWV